MKRLRRKVRKQLDLFTKDHCWGRGTWLPRKLRKVRPYTDAEAALLWDIRTAAIEAGRRRLVARGCWQYAEAGDLTLEQVQGWLASGHANLRPSVWAEHGLAKP